MVDDDSYSIEDVEFDAEGVILRGWLFRPKNAASLAPVVVMAHGYNCVKELYLDRYAAAFAGAGHIVLAYDHRNFGDSEGEPRHELDPWVQVRDYRHAITFAQTLDGVDADRIYGIGYVEQNSITRTGSGREPDRGIDRDVVTFIRARRGLGAFAMVSALP